MRETTKKQLARVRTPEPEERVPARTNRQQRRAQASHARHELRRHGRLLDEVLRTVKKNFGVVEPKIEMNHSNGFILRVAAGGQAVIEAGDISFDLAITKLMRAARRGPKTDQPTAG